MTETKNHVGLYLESLHREARLGEALGAALEQLDDERICFAEVVKYERDRADLWQNVACAMAFDNGLREAALDEVWPVALPQRLTKIETCPHCDGTGVDRGKGVDCGWCEDGLVAS